MLYLYMMITVVNNNTKILSHKNKEICLPVKIKLNLWPCHETKICKISHGITVGYKSFENIKLYVFGDNSIEEK